MSDDDRLPQLAPPGESEEYGPEPWNLRREARELARMLAVVVALLLLMAGWAVAMGWVLWQIERYVGAVPAFVVAILLAGASLIPMLLAIHWLVNWLDD